MTSISPSEPPSRLRSFLASRWGLLVLCGLAIFGLYLLITHTGHVLAAAPYLILLACPLLHFFMHRGHGGHH